jgi:hypothetical protein
LQISRSVANRVNYFFLLSFLRIKKQFNMIWKSLINFDQPIVYLLQGIVSVL